MTTEEMDQLDRQVAELMGLYIAEGWEVGLPSCPYILKQSSGLMYRENERSSAIPWQPTRDPRCERIVVEWARSQSYLVTFAFCANGDCVVGIRNACGKRAGASSVPPDTPGIALCLAVVEAFGGK